MHRQVLILCLLLLGTAVAAQPAGEKTAPQAQQTAWLLFGDIKPRGWLLQQMERDLDYGFTGHLDKLVPDLVVADDIYGKDRLTREVKTKDVGAIKHDEAWEVQYLWWNSETQSNWWDGYVRNALLTGNEEAMRRTREYVNRMLSLQDADGYMGIYAPDLRYNFTGENGELWAQSTLFRALLAYYEATNDQSVLEAVERAADVTMRKYSPASPPFKVEKPFGGVEHGLTITDTFDRLYQLTGKEKYLAYAHWLYQNFSEYPMSQDDAQYAHLIDPGYRFKAHGVHTYEHLRSVVTAFYASGDKKLKKAIQGFLDKLDPCLTPSGGPIGDEWIGGRNADPSETGYEYCSIHELLDSYTHLMQKTGDLSYGDRIEWLLFNAGQGARHPEGHSIAYLKTDNSFSMTGPLHPGAADDKQTRYKYSPVHQDAAVCCVPNAGRIFPY
ncbi:MAG TPA: beta-L-arabinofuranosidase domain-containing protein, partial [Ohtaekwangia sp.]|nr:beta-L-arabinofuranosidase domain-containing protein [Ohtaekwangia sp.]